MKKLWLIGFLISAFSSLQAQDKITYGMGAGINISNITDNQDGGYYSPSDKVGFRGYLFADMQVAKYFSLETDLGYDAMGFKVHDDQVGTVTSSINYLTLSILPKVHIKQSGVGFFAGPAIGFKLSSPVSANGNSSDFDGYNPVDFFITLGMEYITPVGLGISFRIMPGLTNIAKDTAPGETVHNDNIGINLVYQFK